MFTFSSRESRLIVAADLRVKPGSRPREQAEKYLVDLCDALGDLGVTIKINTIARMLGERAVEYIHDRGLSCFLDLKLFDIRNTIVNDLAWINYYSPLMLTIAERVHPEAITSAIMISPNTLILPVGPLTDLTDAEFVYFNEESREAAVKSFFKRCRDCEVEGVITSPRDIAFAEKPFTDSIATITPGIQPSGMTNNNSANALTAPEAFAAGAAAIVVGRAITEAVDKRAAAKQFLSEIP